MYVYQLQMNERIELRAVSDNFVEDVYIYLRMLFFITFLSTSWPWLLQRESYCTVHERHIDAKDKGDEKWEAQTSLEAEMRQMYGRVNRLSAARGGVCISGMEVQMDLLDVVDMEIYMYCTVHVQMDTTCTTEGTDSLLEE